MTALTNEALRLSPGDRLKLIEEVWQSLCANPASVPTSADELHELDARRERYTANPESLVDWEELKQQISQRRRNAH